MDELWRGRMQPAILPSLEVALCDCKASDDVSSHPISIGAASSSVGLMVTRAITITARSAPASDGEALHMNAYHTSNLIHVLRLSLDPAKSSRTASCRTRWIYLPDGFYHGLVKSKRYLATDRIAIAAQAHFAAVLTENNLRGVLVCMLVSARSRAITTPG